MFDKKEDAHEKAELGKENMVPKKHHKRHVKHHRKMKKKGKMR